MGKYGEFADSHDAAAWAMLELGRLMSPAAEAKWQALDEESRAHLQSVTADVLRERDDVPAGAALEGKP